MPACPWPPAERGSLPFEGCLENDRLEKGTSFLQNETNQLFAIGSQGVVNLLAPGWKQELEHFCLYAKIRDSLYLLFLFLDESSLMPHWFLIKQTLNPYHGRKN